MTISLLAGAYLFFGGAGAGAVFWATLSRGRMATRALGTGLALLVAGTICLVFDLGRSEQALLLFVSPTWSFLTVGAYLLAALLLVGAALFLMYLLMPAKAQVSVLFCALRVLAAMLALGVMTYTGLLLRDLKPVHLWTSWWLPVLFVLSSLAAGAACVLLCTSPLDETQARGRGLAGIFAKTDAALVAGEAAVCAVYLLGVTASPLGASSVATLVAGEHAALFWVGFVLCGIAAPLAVDAAVLARPNAVPAGAATGAAFAGIIGCFCLRASLVLAGAHVVI